MEEGNIMQMLDEMLTLLLPVALFILGMWAAANPEWFYQANLRQLRGDERAPLNGACKLYHDLCATPGNIAAYRWSGAGLALIGAAAVWVVLHAPHG
jgi:hypothetical protein